MQQDKRYMVSIGLVQGEELRRRYGKQCEHCSTNGDYVRLSFNSAEAFQHFVDTFASHVFSFQNDLSVYIKNANDFKQDVSQMARTIELSKRLNSSYAFMVPGMLKYVPAAFLFCEKVGNQYAITVQGKTEYMQDALACKNLLQKFLHSFNFKNELKNEGEDKSPAFLRVYLGSLDTEIEAVYTALAPLKHLEDCSILGYKPNIYEKDVKKYEVSLSLIYNVEIIKQYAALYQVQINPANHYNLKFTFNEESAREHFCKIFAPYVIGLDALNAYMPNVPGTLVYFEKIAEAYVITTKWKQNKDICKPICDAWFKYFMMTFTFNKGQVTHKTNEFSRRIYLGELKNNIIATYTAYNNKRDLKNHIEVAGYDTRTAKKIISEKQGLYEPDLLLWSFAGPRPITGNNMGVYCIPHSYIYRASAENYPIYIQRHTHIFRAYQTYINHLEYTDQDIRYHDSRFEDIRNIYVGVGNHSATRGLRPYYERCDRERAYDQECKRAKSKKPTSALAYEKQLCTGVPSITKKGAFVSLDIIGYNIMQDEQLKKIIKPHNNSSRFAQTEEANSSLPIVKYIYKDAEQDEKQGGHMLLCNHYKQYYGWDSSISIIQRGDRLMFSVFLGITDVWYTQKGLHDDLYKVYNQYVNQRIAVMNLPPALTRTVPLEQHMNLDRAKRSCGLNLGSPAAAALFMEIFGFKQCSVEDADGISEHAVFQAGQYVVFRQNPAFSTPEMCIVVPNFTQRLRKLYNELFETRLAELQKCVLEQNVCAPAYFTKEKHQVQAQGIVTMSLLLGNDYIDHTYDLQDYRYLHNLKFSFSMPEQCEQFYQQFAPYVFKLDKLNAYMPSFGDAPIRFAKLNDQYAVMLNTEGLSDIFRTVCEQWLNNFCSTLIWKEKQAQFERINHLCFGIILGNLKHEIMAKYTFKNQAGHLAREGQGSLLLRNFDNELGSIYMQQGHNMRVLVNSSSNSIFSAFDGAMIVWYIPSFSQLFGIKELESGDFEATINCQVKLRSYVTDEGNIDDMKAFVFYLYYNSFALYMCGCNHFKMTQNIDLKKSQKYKNCFYIDFACELEAKLFLVLFGLKSALKINENNALAPYIFHEGNCVHFLNFINATGEIVQNSIDVSTSVLKSIIISDPSSYIYEYRQTILERGLANFSYMPPILPGYCKISIQGSSDPTLVLKFESTAVMQSFEENIFDTWSDNEYKTDECSIIIRFTPQIMKKRGFFICYSAEAVTAGIEFLEVNKADLFLSCFLQQGIVNPDITVDSSSLYFNKLRGCDGDVCYARISALSMVQQPITIAATKFDYSITMEWLNDVTYSVFINFAKPETYNNICKKVKDLKLFNNKVLAFIDSECKIQVTMEDAKARKGYVYCINCNDERGLNFFMRIFNIDLVAQNQKIMLIGTKLFFKQSLYMGYLDCTVTSSLFSPSPGYCIVSTTVLPATTLILKFGSVSSLQYFQQNIFSSWSNNEYKIDKCSIIILESPNKAMAKGYHLRLEDGFIGINFAQSDKAKLFLSCFVQSDISNPNICIDSAMVYFKQLSICDSESAYEVKLSESVIVTDTHSQSKSITMNNNSSPKVNINPAIVSTALTPSPRTCIISTREFPTKTLKLTFDSNATLQYFRQNIFNSWDNSEYKVDGTSIVVTELLGTQLRGCFVSKRTKVIGIDFKEDSKAVRFLACFSQQLTENKEITIYSANVYFNKLQGWNCTIYRAKLSETITNSSIPPQVQVATLNNNSSPKVNINPAIVSTALTPSPRTCIISTREFPTKTLKLTFDSNATLQYFRQNIFNSWKNSGYEVDGSSIIIAFTGDNAKMRGCFRSGSTKVIGVACVEVNEANLLLSCFSQQATASKEITIYSSNVYFNKIMYWSGGIYNAKLSVAI